MPTGWMMALLAIAAGGGASTIAAQQNPPVGGRVRLTLTDRGSPAIVGVLASADAEALTIQPDHRQESVRVPRSALQGIEVSVERKNHAVDGLLIGAGIGAVTGIVVGLADGDDEPGFYSFTAGEKAAGIGAALGMIGGAMGIIAGALTHSDRWAPAGSAPARAGLLVAPGPGGVRVGLNLRL